MPRTLMILLLLAAPAGAAADADWRTAPRVEITLANFRYAPADIHLRAGRPVVLHLVNAAGGGHNFSAPEFFAAAAVRASDRAAVGGGAVELKAHGARDIALVPAAGRYRLKCTHALHKMLGMSGEIVVD